MIVNELAVSRSSYIGPILDIMCSLVSYKKSSMLYAMQCRHVY